MLGTQESRLHITEQQYECHGSVTGADSRAKPASATWAPERSAVQSAAGHMFERLMQYEKRGADGADQAEQGSADHVAEVMDPQAHA